MTATVQPGTTASVGPAQSLRQSKPGSGAGSATWPVRVGLVILCIGWMIPALGMLVNSFRPRDAQFASGWWTAFFNPFSSSWTFQNYEKALTTSTAGIPMAQAFLNSFIVSLPATVIPILIAAFAAYAFTFMQWRGRDLMFIIIVGLLVVPNQVAFVPLVKLYGALGMNGTFPAIWLAHIGVFNLVPLLPFDGGHVAIAVYERIQERRLGRRRYFTDVSRLLPLTNLVVIALGLLFLSSLYLDVMNPIQT